GALQAVAVRVLTDGDENFPDRSFDPLQVDDLLDRHPTKPAVDQAGSDEVEVAVGVVALRLGGGIGHSAAPRNRVERVSSSVPSADRPWTAPPTRGPPCRSPVGPLACAPGRRPPPRSPSARPSHPA